MNEQTKAQVEAYAEECRAEQLELQAPPPATGEKQGTAIGSGTILREYNGLVREATTSPHRR